MLDPEVERDLRERIAAAGLGEDADLIVKWSRMAIRLRVTTDEGRDDDTRLGGTAALPAGVSWPDEQDFIAQIVLKEIAPFDREQLLPPDGRLLFFYRDDASVLYVPEGAPTVPGRPVTWPARRLQPVRELSLPPTEFLFALGGDECPLYYELVSTYEVEDTPITKLGGYSDPIHRWVHDESAVRESDADWTWEDYPQDGWRLLLQVDSEEEAGMMWGDVGRLYYFIQERDLQARRFDRIDFQRQGH